MIQNYAPKFVICMLCFVTVGSSQIRGTQTICHVPLGNPTASYPHNVSAAAVHAYDSHHDFPGDCWSGCTAESVVSFVQGMQNNGSPVAANRSNPNAALGTPDGVNEVNGFYSLGFGGSVVLKMDGGILNRPGNDLLISETSFNQPSCESYPEQAEVFVSEDKINWVSLGIICQDSEVDIAPLDWIMYVKIVDVSDPALFNGVVDGFDLDGIHCVNTPQQRIETVDENPDFSLFSVPVKETLNVRYSGFIDPDVLILEVFDLNGRSEWRKEVRTNETQGTLQLSAGELSKGQHVLHITSSSAKKAINFLKT